MSTTFTNIGNQAYSDGYKPTVAFMRFYVRQPYSCNSISYLESLYLTTVTATSIWGGSGGRFLDVLAIATGSYSYASST